MCSLFLAPVFWMSDLALFGEVLSLVLTIPFTAWLGWEAWQYAARSRVATVASVVVSIFSWLYCLSLVLVVVGVIEPGHWSPIMRWPGMVLWAALAVAYTQFRKFARDVNRRVEP